MSVHNLERASSQPANRRSVTSSGRVDCKWALPSRLSEEDIALLIKRYHEGAIGLELAKEFNISLSSVRRLLRAHRARLQDRMDP